MIFFIAKNNQKNQRRDSNGRKKKMRPLGAFSRPGVIVSGANGANPSFSAIKDMIILEDDLFYFAKSS